MTRTLIFSDIHGNREAFNALKRQADTMKIDEYRCLGDVLGYYGYPSLWQRVFDLDKNLRLGNHEVYVGRAGLPDAADSGVLTGINRKALMAAFRHRALLKKTKRWNDFYKVAADDQRQCEQIDPPSGKYRNIWVHAAPFGLTPSDKSANGPYVKPIPDATSKSPSLNWREITRYIRDQRQNQPDHISLLWFGHTHTPTLALIDDKGENFKGAVYNEPFSIPDLIASAKTETPINAIAINPGSVGQPRQGVRADHGATRYAHAALFDSDMEQLTFWAVPYVFNRPDVSYDLGQDDYLPTVSDEDLLVLCRVCIEQNALIEAVDVANLEARHLDQIFKSIETDFNDLVALTRKRFLKNTGTNSRSVAELTNRLGKESNKVNSGHLNELAQKLEQVCLEADSGNVAESACQIVLESVEKGSLSAAEQLLLRCFLIAEITSDIIRDSAQDQTLSDNARILLNDLWWIESTDLIHDLEKPAKWHDDLFVYNYTLTGFTLRK